MILLQEIWFILNSCKNIYAASNLLLYIIYAQLCFVSCVNNGSSDNYKILSAYSARKSGDNSPEQGQAWRKVGDILGDEMIRISNEELAIPFIEEMYKSFSYTTAVPDTDKILDKITSKLSNKLNEMFSMLDTTKQLLESYSKVDDRSVFASTIYPCLYAPFNSIDHKEYVVNKRMINPNNSYSEDALNLSEAFEKEQSRAKHLKLAIKQQYFLSSSDTRNDHLPFVSRCDLHDDALLWKTYMSWLKSPPRRVLLLLDHGGSLSGQQIAAVKAVAKQMISVLSPRDKVGVIALSDDLTSPFFTENCLTPNQPPDVSSVCSFASATSHNKDLLYRFVETLAKGNGATNHSLGFQTAFDALRGGADAGDHATMLLYISRGLLSSLTEARTVLETIAKGLESVEEDVVINTCAVIDDTKPIMYEMHFLRDIVELNFTKYNINAMEATANPSGILLSVNSTRGIGLAAARFYATLTETRRFDSSPSRKLSLPTWDVVSKDLTVTATVPCGPNLGILGMDVFFGDLMEDVAYYSNHLNYTYAFVLTLNGTVVMHPSYPRPMFVPEQPQFVDVSYLEKYDDFATVKRQLLTQPRGTQYAFRTTANGTERMKYVWKRVDRWYIVCIVARSDSSTPPSRPYKVSWFHGSSTELVHHRLDLLPSTSMCLHLKQLSTIDAGSLFLSASCFQSPFLGPSGFSVTPLKVQSYMAYLKDSTRLLANPGLKEEVRDDVAALAPILDYLARRHLRGTRARYVVRRYLTTPGGVMEMFPGGVVPASLEPTRRSWFVRAVEHRSKLILTPPYLDAGGAGYIVTLAVATPHLVTAMDVTYGYVYKLILQAMPYCTAKNVKCFMMDDRGYLIYHPHLIDPNGRGPIEQQHIIHKESLVANDILNHQHFVRKVLCNSYADGKIQRYYKLNTSATNTLTNIVHGEHCVKYHVTAIAGTNVFIGTVNSTCDDVQTFCPCSMVDRLCLNCNRMEQTECECPCECPLALDTCAHPNRTLTENELCAHTPEQAHPVPANILVNFLFKPKPCALSLPCDMYRDYDSCLGVVGCEWCERDVDGESPLPNQFCTSIRTCFNGVLGSVTPYGDPPLGVISSEDLMVSNYSPVGPVAGALLGLFIVFGLLFYCYRHYATDHRMERVYLSDGGAHQAVRMSNLDLHDDFHEDMDAANHQDKLLQATKKAEPLSPYCVSTGYRRPTPAADSDHGYSTMTPHEESEHLSFALIELESVEDDFATSDAASTNTSVSTSKQPPHKRPPVDKQPSASAFTQVPPKNCFLAPVTVHRHMETM